MKMIALDGARPEDIPFQRAIQVTAHEIDVISKLAARISDLPIRDGIMVGLHVGSARVEFHLADRCSECGRRK